MRELQPLGMQEVSAVAGKARVLLQPAARLVQRIAKQRMPRIRHVDADLMRTSRRDLDAEQRLIVTLLEHDGDAV